MPLATALLYGIRSDTQDLGREATRADIAATLYLYPLASQRTLSRIQNAVVPREYFAMLSCALRRAVVGGRGVFCSLGSTANPDMVGELADLLLRYEGCTWVLTCGLCGAVLRLSLRCRPDPDADAGSVVSRLVGSLGTGGGHGAAAGGQVPCPPRRHAAVVRTLKQRFLRFVGSPPAGLSPLVPRRQQTLPGKILRIL
jgi:nanoRNase/pAp phosphatase (c-di-AMP/oligoRNAs hydrolase)